MTATYQTKQYTLNTERVKVNESKVKVKYLKAWYIKHRTIETDQGMSTLIQQFGRLKKGKQTQSRNMSNVIANVTNLVRSQGVSSSRLLDQG